MTVVLALAGCGGGTAELFAEPTFAEAEVVAESTAPDANEGDATPGESPTSLTPMIAADSEGGDAAGDEVPVVVIDPGHGGDEIGAAAHGVIEKDSNLDLSFRIEAVLLEAGVEVVLTRRSDERVAGTEATGFGRSRIDRQARVDIANDAGADVFVSVHSNGIGDPAVRGIETYYNSQRSFAEENIALARMVHDHVLEAIGATGHSVVDRGIRDDGCLFVHRGICRPIFVLGPARGPGSSPATGPAGTRATQMPGALVELLFITHPADAALLQDETVRDALARGVADGILAFLESRSLWEGGAR